MRILMSLMYLILGGMGYLAIAKGEYLVASIIPITVIAVERMEKYE